MTSMSNVQRAGAQILDLPRRAVSAVAPAVVPAQSVDDWGRDPHLVHLLSPLFTARWAVSVGGVEHLPAHAGALLVTNSRRLSFSPLYVSWALSRATGRAVRFVGRPDLAPIGPALRRLGALLHDPIEVRGALRQGELVLMAAQSATHPRHAGTVDHELIGAAVAEGVQVHPVASMSTPFTRSARAEVGAVVRTRRARRGPLAEIELAEATQRQLQTMLDELGGLHTGMAPIDFLGEG